MKYYLSIMLIFLSFLSYSQTLPPNASLDKSGRGEEKDKFYLQLTSLTFPSIELEEVTLVVNTRMDSTKTSDDSDLMGSNPQWKFSVLGYDNGQMNYPLKTDRRGRGEYDKNYYVDFPLSQHFSELVGTRYNLHLDKSSVNKAAVVVRLYDLQHPEHAFINLLSEDYEFVSEAEEKDKRFIVRVYAANLFKKDAVDNKWNNANNWIGGQVPGLSTNARIDNCVVIPAGKTVVIQNGENITLNTLLNSGTLTVNEGASLTLDYETQLAPFANMY
ncbi:hypothetical protein FACS189423_10240 [Bacteroidia bacterium]|nr:hypothetical protein FACS189423_10240 [Bacteroidia bacterium]